MGILLPRLGLVRRALRDGLQGPPAFVCLSGIEVNGTDLCRRILVPIMICFGCCPHVFIVDSYYCLS
jgi:hypothetical protein